MSNKWFLNFFQQSSDDESEKDSKWVSLKIGDDFEIGLSRATSKLIVTVALSVIWNFSRRTLPFILGFLLGGGIRAFGTEIYKPVEPITNLVSEPTTELDTEPVDLPVVNPAAKKECPPT